MTDPKLPASPESITALLWDLRAGLREAEPRLVQLIYSDLHQLAGRYMARERRDHTLQPTALVNEVYLRLLKEQDVGWQNRAHFFGVASQLMRRILVDYARAHHADKRGGHDREITLAEGLVATESKDVRLIDLDRALERLAQIDPRQCRIVEMRSFGGLSLDEVAVVLDLSIRTVKRDWKVARAWLYGELNGK